MIFLYQKQHSSFENFITPLTFQKKVKLKLLENIGSKEEMEWPPYVPKFLNKWIIRGEIHTLITVKFIHSYLYLQV